MFRLARVVAGLAAGALVAGPAEVLDAGVGRVGDAVDLLPVVPADVADPELVGAGPDREAERVAEAVGDDPARVRVGARRRAGCRAAPAPVSGSTRMIVPSSADRVAGGAEVLAAQRAALGGRRRLRAADAAGRVAARVERDARLAVVDEVEARAVAAADVERAVRRRTRGRRSSGSGTAGTSPRSAPARRRPSRCRSPCSRDSRPLTTQPSVGRAGRRRARSSLPGVPQRGAVPPIGGVVGVEDVDVRRRREVRVERQAEQAAVPVVVHLRPQVGEAWSASCRRGRRRP